MTTPHTIPVRIAIAPDRPNIPLPSYAHDGDAGMDVLAAESFELEPGERRAVRTGIIFEIPLGYEMQIRPKSGLALNSGITVLNAPSTIDSGYRGEVKVVLVNLGCVSVHFATGTKIAQLVFAPVTRAELHPARTEDLSATERGTGGFGSTGA